jgi:sugar transferase (PEP-CTERM/EpsH1 system associated)
VSCSIIAIRYQFNQAFSIRIRAMDVLYVSHCVPWPPDKGDRIRAHYSLRALLDHHRVHLAALARSQAEADAPSELRERLASARIEVMDPRWAVVRGFAGLAAGGSFTTAFHRVPALRAHIRATLRRHRIGAAVILSSSMASYAEPLAGVPVIADWGDVDSEKRLQYAQMRFPGFVQRWEGLRLREVERASARWARRILLTTPNELRLLRRIAPDAVLGCSGNGVDAGYFDPDADIAIPDDLGRRRFLVFVGVLNYFPNSDGVRRFVEQVFPLLRAGDPGLELLLVGRDPTRQVRRLARRDGVSVTGGVPDVRPYLAAARGVVAPLRIARGVQNKVLEALAIGKPVLASEAVCRTFLPELPRGVICCATPADYVRALAALPSGAATDPVIAAATRTRFGWARNLEPLLAELAAIESERGSLQRRHA